MMTAMTTLLSFLMGGVPKLIDFFQDKGDKKHELALAQLQIERELALKKAGLEIEERIAHIETDQIKINADVAQAQTAMKEKESLYSHDVSIGLKASRWVVNARAMVRPAITYGMFLMFVFVETFGFVYAWKSDVSFDVALNHLWDTETQLLWASIIAFWFGARAFSKK